MVFENLNAFEHIFNTSGNVFVKVLTQKLFDLCFKTIVPLLVCNLIIHHPDGSKPLPEEMLTS